VLRARQAGRKGKNKKWASRVTYAIVRQKLLLANEEHRNKVLEQGGDDGAGINGEEPAAVGGAEETDLLAVGAHAG
jgi:hypothetical protein